MHLEQRGLVLHRQCFGASCESHLLARHGLPASLLVLKVNWVPSSRFIQLGALSDRFEPRVDFHPGLFIWQLVTFLQLTNQTAAPCSCDLIRVHGVPFLRFGPGTSWRFRREIGRHMRVLGNSVDRQFPPVGDAQLMEDIVQMILDRLLADKHLRHSKNAAGEQQGAFRNPCSWAGLLSCASSALAFGVSLPSSRCAMHKKSPMSPQDGR
jgi:hypothetical protein